MTSVHDTKPLLSQLKETQEPLSEQAMRAIHCAGATAVGAMEEESQIAFKESLL